jgi:hypothetical protein
MRDRIESVLAFLVLIVLMTGYAIRALACGAWRWLVKSR